MTKGGRQPGAGRPPSTDPARHTVKARLTDTDLDRWNELGAGRWVKRMLHRRIVGYFLLIDGVYHQVDEAYAADDDVVALFAD